MALCAGMRSLRMSLLPDQCVFCRDALRDAGICDRCRALLAHAEPVCERCAAPLAAAQASGVTCGRCQSRAPEYDKAAAALNYCFPIDAALKAFKFDGHLHYARAFASLLLPHLREHFTAADALIPVPLHRWRHARRGFNQATEICRVLARQSGLRMLNVVRRVRATPPQSGLDALQRRRNLSKAFALSRPLACRRPVIVDDIMTTGETCNQVARVLIAAGAESVGVLVVARA